MADKIETGCKTKVHAALPLGAYTYCGMSINRRDRDTQDIRAVRKAVNTKTQKPLHVVEVSLVGDPDINLVTCGNCIKASRW